jgi:hypothetical protein
VNRRVQTTDRRTPVIIGVVVVALLAAALYWFVIRDDSSDKSTKKTTGPLTAQTFTAPGSSFSFKYPGTFAQSTPPADGTVWIAGVGPYDLLRVKRLANKPTAPGRLESTLSRTLGAAPGSQIVDHGRETRADREVVTYKVTSTIQGKALTSRLYFFSANGVTWQFECESQSHAAEIDAACDQALGSLNAVS